MPSQIQIAGWTATLLGETRPSDLSDSTALAEGITEFWDMVRDTLIAQAAWHDFIERVSLAADADAPVWGFDYQYSFNGNVVRPLQIGPYNVGVDLSDYRNADLAEYRIEQRKILTNMGAPLDVKWLINSVDVGLWQPCFAKLMAADLAENLNPRITESDAGAQRLAQWRFRAWSEANVANAIEDPPDPHADSEWIAAHNS